MTRRRSIEFDHRQRFRLEAVKRGDGLLRRHLLTQMTAQEAIAAFDRFEAEALAVVELDRAPSGDWPAQPAPRRRRYSDASERQRRQLSGEL